MKSVTVDPAKCRGHAQCLMYAPDVFAWKDADDQSYVPDQSSVAQYEQDVSDAAAACPEQAIVID